MRRFIPLLFLILAGVPAHAKQQVIPDFLERYHRILQQAYANSADEMKYAQSKGAVFTPLPNGDGLSMYWEPAGASKNKKMLVVLPGEKSDAWKEFRFWHPLIERRDTALLIPQWDSGNVSVIQTTPHSLYPVTIHSSFISKGFAKGSGILYAPPKHSSYVYGMAALDRAKGGGKFFGTLIADDGPADFNDPIVRQINNNINRNTFDTTQWVLYCSSDCVSMNKTASWLLYKGGKVELFIQEPKNKGRTLRDEPDRLKAALDTFLQ